VTVGDYPWIEHATLDVAVGALDQQRRLFVAVHAPGVIFVHDGVVAVEGRALAIPARPSPARRNSLSPGRGRSRLPLGRVCRSRCRRHDGCHSEARGAFGDANSMFQRVRRVVAQNRAELALVVLARYPANAQWLPEPRSTPHGVVILLANTVPAQERPREGAAHPQPRGSGARIVEGERGDARAIAPLLLEELGAPEDHCQLLARVPLLSRAPAAPVTRGLPVEDLQG
jgi:hypothetical protein